MSQKTEYVDIEKDSPQRSISKAISWRILASLTTFIIFYFTAGQKIAIEVITAAVGVEVISKMIIYYLHERLWTNIVWGKYWRRQAARRRVRRINRIRKKKNGKVSD
jgi:uncharacterized membrane protein